MGGHQIVVGTGVMGRLAGAEWPRWLTLTDAHSESWGLGWAWQMAPLIRILHVAGASHGVVSEFRDGTFQAECSKTPRWELQRLLMI